MERRYRHIYFRVFITALLVLIPQQFVNSFCITQVHRIVSLRLSAAESDPVKSEKVFIFGLGYVGSLLAYHLKSQGYIVSGTCTNVNKALEFRNNGINTFLFDEMSQKRHQLEALDEIVSSQYVLSTIPPLGTGSNARDIVLEAHANDLRQAALNGLKWVGYLSSTGVYGDCEGAWVTESRPVNPENDKTLARAEVEKKWRQLYDRSGLPVNIFRLAGIYGDGRSAIDTLIKAVTTQQTDPSAPTFADDSTFISRIHVEDIVTVLEASMKTSLSGQYYNVADDLPSTRFDVLSYAGRLLGIRNIVPAGGNKEKSKASGETRGGSKRVDNMKVKQLLSSQNKQLKFADYRTGLSALFQIYQSQNRIPPLTKTVTTREKSTPTTKSVTNEQSSSINGSSSMEGNQLTTGDLHSLPLN